MTEIVIRTIINYTLIIFALRIMGKRQLGELQPSEFVSTIMVSNIATLPVENLEISLLAGILPILTLVCFEVFLSTVTLKSGKIRKLVSGSPRIIIRDGKIDQKELKNLRFSIDDLMAQLRVGGIFNIEDVYFAIAETNGKLSIYERFDEKDTIKKTLGLEINIDAKAPPVLLISDGKLDMNALAYCNTNEKWLNEILIKNKTSVENVFIMSCDRDKKYKIYLKDSI